MDADAKPAMPMWKQIVAWLGVLPAAAGAALLVQLGLIVFVKIHHSGEDWAICLFSYVIAPTTMPWAFVAAGAAVAPTHKSRVRIALATLSLGYCLALVYCRVVGGFFSSIDNTPAFGFYLCCLCHLIGTGAGAAAHE